MPRRRRDRQGALFCAMQQLKGERGGCSPQANKGKQSDPALQHRGLSTGRVLLPPRRGRGGDQPVSTSPRASSTMAAAGPIGRFAAACGAEGTIQQGPGWWWWWCKRCRRGGIRASAAALPRSRLEGVLWWLVGHRLRLAHKERGREGESGTKQRGLSENPGVCLPNNVHSASQTVVSIVIQERPRRREKKRKKADHAMQG